MTAPELVVVCAPEAAAGFRLAGAAVVSVDDPRQAERAVAEAAAANPRGVVAVTARLWSAATAAARTEWSRTMSPLVVALPDDGGTATVEIGRQAALKNLLAGAVGYEMTFTAEDDHT